MNIIRRREALTEDIYTNNAYVTIEPYMCVHEWSNEWSFNETHHWHNCTKAAEGKKIYTCKSCGAKDYTVVSGSTIVTLNAGYLNTLSEGEHIFPAGKKPFK